MTQRIYSSLRTSAEPFLDYLDRWFSDLPIVSLKSLLKEHSADRTALVIVDVVNGFCKEGNLASPRIGRIVPEIVRLVRTADQQGVNHFLLPQDQHPGSSLEFQIYPEHCVEGSVESKTVDELQNLPNAGKFKVFPKRSINPGMERSLQDWLEQNPDITLFIVTGDCTDICVHQMAMFLKIRSITRNTRVSIVVPADCVDTYDVAPQPGAHNGPPPHPGDLMQRVFLYHMHLNGIKIVAGIE